MPEPIDVTLFIDPACPWGYSATPALSTLRRRYGAGLRWRLALIGLTERAEEYTDKGFTAKVLATFQPRFRRYGMPFAIAPKARMSGTARLCRAVEAARQTRPGSEWTANRALQIAGFMTPMLLDDDGRVADVVAAATDIPADTILRLLDDPAVTAAFEADRAEARTAAGTPAEAQDKTAKTGDGEVRYTAPSLVFERGGSRLIAGGMQPVEAYDVIVANIDPSLPRTAIPDGPLALIEEHPEGLTTAEVAAMLARGNDAPDREAAEVALLELVADGAVFRTGMGDGAMWSDEANAARWRAVLAAGNGEGALAAAA